MTAVVDGRPLAELTTLGLGGPARHFVRLERAENLPELLDGLEGPVRFLGGGSNLVVPDGGVDGTVVQLATRGLSLREEGGVVELTAAAGEPWQAVVDLALERNLAGVECLTGIPGSVGATPIQNVGAYGQEVADTLREVEVLERATGVRRWLSAGECGFGYRDSAFKRNPGRHVVLTVRLALRPGGPPTLRYGELTRALAARSHAPTLREVADCVWQLRAGKSMVLQPGDPNRRSAGSFFTNPIVDDGLAGRVRSQALDAGLTARAEDMPCFPAGEGRSKLAAGWLIERAGFEKGLRRGAVGISSKHALSLVHHGGGTTAELLALAAEIQAGVEQRFGVALSIEPTRW